MKTFKEARELLNSKKDKNEMLTYNEAFDLAILCSRFLRINPNEGREIVIRMQDVWNLIPDNTHLIWNDLTESAGLYPYVDPFYLSKSALIRY